MNYLTTKQVAEILNVSQSRVRQLIMEDRLISTKIGRDNLVNQDDLDDLDVNKKYKLHCVETHEKDVFFHPMNGYG